MPPLFHSLCFWILRLGPNSACHTAMCDRLVQWCFLSTIKCFSVIQGKMSSAHSLLVMYTYKCSVQTSSITLFVQVDKLVRHPSFISVSVSTCFKQNEIIIAHAIFSQLSLDACWGVLRSSSIQSLQAQ